MYALSTYSLTYIFTINNFILFSQQNAHRESKKKSMNLVPRNQHFMVGTQIYLDL